MWKIMRGCVLFSVFCAIIFLSLPGWAAEDIFAMIEKGDIDGVKAAIAEGSDPNIRNSRQQTPIFIAARNASPEIVALLLNASADVTLKDDTGASVLFSALRLPLPTEVSEVFLEKKLEVVNLLLGAGVDVNAVDNAGTTPLMFFTVIFGNKEWLSRESVLMFLNTLLAAGLDLNARNSEGATALLLAAGIPKGKLAEALIDAGADVTAKEPTGMTALHWAAWNGTREVIKKLVASGLNVEARNSEGMTALHYAAVGYRSRDVVELLISLGADVNAQGEGSATPLFVACMGGASSVAAALLENGADVNTRGDGLTLLHLATGYLMEAKQDIGWDEMEAEIPRNFLGLTKTLVEFGADINALSGKVNDAGVPYSGQFSEKTPLDFAEAIGNIEIAQYLKSIGAKSGTK